MQTNPLGDISLDHFLSEYWQKRPLLIRNALPDIISPISADELAGLACEQDVESRIIINLHEDWQLQHGPFDENIFSELPASNWTLLVQAVDHYIPEASRLMEQFNFIPQWRIDDLMVSYACKQGGVGAHYDNYDVFLIQTQGQRLWEIGGAYDDSSPLKENLPVKILERFTAEASWIVNPGDILYLPPGIGHSGVAQSNDCITCSVGFRAPSYNDILHEYTDYLGQELSESMRFSDKNIKRQINSGEIDHDVLTQLHTIIKEQLQNKDKLQDWFGCYITTPKYEIASYFNNEEPVTTSRLDELTEKLTNGQQLYRNMGSRFAFIRHNEKNKLYVNGHYIPTNSNSNTFVEQLCNKTVLSYQDFNLTDENLLLLQQLINQHAIYVN